MRGPNWMAGAGLFAAALLGLASTAGAQRTPRSHPPFVHVYSRAGSVASNYVEPSIEVGEDAYVFAVAVDLDGHIQVLYPEYAGISVRLSARREVQLKNFFAGFNQDGGGAYSRRELYNSRYESGYGYSETRGVIIALASRAPFNFQRLETNGEWNISAIRSLIDNRSPSLAAENLARYIGGGQPIGRDFMRFAGQNNSRYTYFPEVYADPCERYAYALGGGRGLVAADRRRALAQGSHLQSQAQNIVILGADACGRPILGYVDGGAGGAGVPSGRIPRFPGDTTVFPKTQGIAATGAFAMPGRAGTIPSEFPQSRSSEARAQQPNVILGDPRRRAEPFASTGDQVYAAPMRAPRVERSPGLGAAPQQRRAERDINGGPAQGSFGSWGVSEGARSPRVIEARPQQREAAPARSQSTPRSDQPRSQPAPAATSSRAPSPPPAGKN